jgi:hypothetical protein
VHCGAVGRELRALSPKIVSRRVQAPYLGYLQAQKQRLTGERGQKRIHRPALEQLYGFDTKYAMHMLRLGFQGVELLTAGRLSLPMREPERSYLLGPARPRQRTGLSHACRRARARTRRSGNDKRAAGESGRSWRRGVGGEDVPGSLADAIEIQASRLEPRIDRLALQRQDAERALVHASQRLG